MGVSTLVDLVKVLTTTSGTGALVLDTAVPSFRGVEALVVGKTYSYCLQPGANFEYGTGIWDGTTLTRGVIQSSYGNGPIPLVPGATVTFVALAEDVQSGLAGVPGPPTLQIAAFFIQPLTTSEIFALYIAPTTFTFPANFSTVAAPAVGAIATPPAATMVIGIDRQVRGAGAFASIGTISIATSGLCTFATVGNAPVIIQGGDVIRAIGPATVDASAASFTATLKGF